MRAARNCAPLGAAGESKGADRMCHVASMLTSASNGPAEQIVCMHMPKNARRCSASAAGGYAGCFTSSCNSRKAGLPYFLQLNAVHTHTQEKDCTQCTYVLHAYICVQREGMWCRACGRRCCTQACGIHDLAAEHRRTRMCHTAQHLHLDWRAKPARYPCALGLRKRQPPLPPTSTTMVPQPLPAAHTTRLGPLPSVI